MSSSPSLPSPSQLLSSMPLYPQCESKIAPTPSSLVAGFASASTLLRQAYSEGENGSFMCFEKFDEQERNGLQKARNLRDKIETKGGSERRPVSEETKDSNEKADSNPKNLAKILSDADANCVKDNVSPAPKKSQKKKGIKADKAQKRIRKSNITKPGASKRAQMSNKTAALTKKPSEAVTGASAVMMSTQVEDAQAREEFLGLCLEKAIPRRKEWTPVKDTVRKLDYLDAIEGSGASHPPAEVLNADEPRATCFDNLASDFGFAQKADGSAASLEARDYRQGKAVAKRRKIELVDGGPPVFEKPQKKKLSKKAQTVTAKATAPFMPLESSTSSPLLQYLGTPAVGSEKDLHNDNINAATAVIGRPRPAAKKAPKTKALISKTKKQNQPTLLSPESAMKSARNQELVFGTSSQLAQEESPIFLKEIQQAIKASEPMDDEWGPLLVSAAKFKPYNSLAVTRSKELWSVASRDSDGALLSAEIVDLSDTPKPCSTLTKPTLFQTADSSLETEQQAPVDGRPNTAPTSNPIVRQLNLEVPPTLLKQCQEPDLARTRCLAEAALKKRSRNQSPVKKVSDSNYSSDHMPNYNGFTDVQLSKAVASYGFKSIKKREAMIVLLQKCWESKVSMALQESSTNAKIPKPSTSTVDTIDDTSRKWSPAKKKGRIPIAAAASILASKTSTVTPLKKPRGRPRKDPTSLSTPKKSKPKLGSPNRSDATATAVSLAADEIYDSSPPTPSPRRRRSPPESPSQLPLKQTIDISTAAADVLTAKSDRTQLFAEITKAITTFPPTNHANNMTFHEKMLLYEPVVLEDLTIWLNTIGLGSVGEDAEVSPEQVKAWCEERSVCCLWRENLRGGTRARF